MISARRVGRWALFAAGGALVLLVLARVGVGIYLNTATGKAFVGRQISARINMPVEVTNIRLGLRTSTISLKVFDPSASDPAKGEVFAVESADADISLFALARGDIAPKTVELQNANLQLHVSADGKVLTQMPKLPEGGGGRLPAVILTGAQVTVHQEGKPEFTIKNLNVQVQPTGDTVKLTGTIDDPLWAKWTVSGDINPATKTGTVELATDDGPLTMDRLGSIPFVPESVWRHVGADGRGAAVVKFAVGSDGEVRYGVDVRPNAANLTLPDLDATLTKVTGLIRVAGQRVELQGTRGELAGGTITVDGGFDFAPEPTRAKLDVTAAGLDIQRLPAEWGLPREIEGKLKGNANLALKIHSSGKVEPTGGGEGEIVGAKIRGLDATVKIGLRSDGTRYRFDQPKKAGLLPPFHPEGVGQPSALSKWSFALDSAPHPPRRLSKTTACGDLSPQKRGEVESLAFSPAIRTGSSHEDTEDNHLAPLGGARSPRAVASTAVAAGEGPSSFTRPQTKPRAARQPKKDPPPAPKKDTLPTTLDATITLRDIEIGELLQKLEVKLDYKISGKVSAELTLAVPVGSVASSSAYEFTGKVSSRELKLEGLTLRDLSATATYKNGKLTLTELKGAILQPGDAEAQPGTFRGSATAAVDPPGDVTASLTLDRIPLGEVLKAIPNWTLDVKGIVSGKAELKGPYDKLSDTTAWIGSAKVTAPELVVAGRTAKGAKLSASVAKGTVTLKDLSATVEGVPVTATGALELSGKYPFTASLKTSGTDVADLRKLVPELDLPAPVEGVLETETRLTGTGAPFAFTASGTVKATKLTLAKTPANHVEFKWEASPDRFKLTSLKADVFGGSLTGNADVPFAADKGGSFALTFKEFDIAAATPLIPDFPVRVTGRVSGTVKGTIDPAKAEQSRVGNLDVDLTAPKLTVQGIPAERLVGKATIKSGALEYSLEGKTLGGSFEVKGRYPGQKKKDEGGAAPDLVRAGWGNGAEAPAAFDIAARVQPKDRGSFRLTGADLSRAAADLGIPSLAPLRGRLDVAFDFDNDLASGSGRIILTGLKWGDASIGRDLSAVIVLRNGILQVADVSGGLAGGTVRGRAQIRLNNTDRNYFSLAIEGADAKRLLAVVPDLAEKVDGSVTIAIRGRIGREFHGSGTLTLERGTVAGIAVSGLRIPFDWATAPGGYGRFAVREATVHAGTGTAQADLTVEWGTEVRVDGLVKLVNVPVRAIAPGIGDNVLLGNGRITGRFDLAGRSVRSTDDLTGTLVATLGNASPREIPLIEQAVPFLNPAGLVKPFDTGDIRASLNRGVFRIQRLALVSPTAQLFAEGTITTAGRVDMNVVAHSGTFGPEARGFRAFGLRVPAFGPIPIGLLRDVSAFLSNRTVRLSITGSVSDPQVKVNLAALVTEEAVRFFLSRYIPGDAAAVLGVGGGLSAFDGMKK